MSSDRLSAEPPVSQGSGSSCCKKKNAFSVKIAAYIYKMDVRQSSRDKTFNLLQSL